MQGQYIQHGSTTPSILLSFINPTTGLPRTDLVFNTASLSIGYRRPGGTVQTLTLGTLATVDAAYASGGFINVSRGVYRLDLPTAAVLTGAISLGIVAVNMPTDVVMIPCVVALGPDDLSVASATPATIAAAVAAPSAATIADGVLGRTISGGASGGRTVSSALAGIRNRVVRSGATLTVYDVDDTTVLYTASVTSDAAAVPITGIDPV